MELALLMKKKVFPLATAPEASEVRVTFVPEMDEIVVPVAMFGPLTPMPADRPAALVTEMTSFALFAMDPVVVTYASVVSVPSPTLRPAMTKLLPVLLGVVSATPPDPPLGRVTTPVIMLPVGLTPAVPLNTPPVSVATLVSAFAFGSLVPEP